MGFGDVRLNAHTNGNILANNLYANANFGTNNIYDELSYIQNYLQVNSGSATSQTHVLAVGNSNSVDLVDNGNAIAVNGTKLDRPKIVWKDTDTQFINLASLRGEMKMLSNTLSTYATSNITLNLNSAGGSVDESYIELTNSNAGGIFNTTATELANLKYMGVKGLSSANKYAVIINVNCEGISQINLPISIIAIDGHNMPLSETHTFTNGRVLWNFYNFLPNAGTTITASLMHASILAEGANFTASQNLNGTIIANNININAESHRDDFISEIPTPETQISITVNKLWFNSDGSTMNSENYSAIFQLLQDNIAYGAPITLNESNGFSYTFNNLPSSSIYAVQEVEVLENEEDASHLFELSIQTAANTITLSNTLKGAGIIVLPATGGYAHLNFTISIVLISTSIILIYFIRRKHENF